MKNQGDQKTSSGIHHRDASTRLARVVAAIKAGGKIAFKLPIRGERRMLQLKSVIGTILGGGELLLEVSHFFVVMLAW